MNTIKCRLCLKESLVTLIDFGDKPRCTDYGENDLKIEEILFNFSLGQCGACGTLQLIETIPEKYLRPKFSWIKNNEPDSHADIISRIVLDHLKGNDKRVLFISKYDKKVFDQTIEYIGDRAYFLDAYSDLGIDQVDFTQAAVQDKINPLVLNKLSNKIGKFDLIVTCRMLEHAHRTNKFIFGLTKLLNKNGNLIIEVPDSTKSLLQGDIAMLWEEHTNYFTPESLRIGLKYLGFKLNKYISYHYPQEDALISVFQYTDDIETEECVLKLPIPTGEVAIGNVFVSKVHQLQLLIIENLKDLKKKHGEVIIFGAGHRTTMFVNLLKIQSYISFVIDDDPNKKDLKIPGTDLEIKDSNFLHTCNNIGVCLLAVGVNAEKNVVKMLNNKSTKKMSFFSISPDSVLSILTY